MHEYYCTSRPPTAFTVPRDGLEQVDRFGLGEKVIPGSSRYVWGTVTYSRRLTMAEVEAYDLRPVSDVERARLVLENETDGDIVALYRGFPSEKLAQHPGDRLACAVLIMREHEGHEGE